MGWNRDDRNLCGVSGYRIRSLLFWRGNRAVHHELDSQYRWVFIPAHSRGPYLGRSEKIESQVMVAHSFVFEGLSIRLFGGMNVVVERIQIPSNIRVIWV